MPRSLVPAALVVLTSCSAALAADPTVSHTLAWTEVYTGTIVPVANPNGRLEPGQSALLSVSVSFSPPVGTPIAYSMPPFSGTAPVAGLGGTVFEVSTSATAWGGTWSYPLAAPGFQPNVWPNFPYGVHGGVGQRAIGSSPWVPLPDNPVEAICCIPGNLPVPASLLVDRGPDPVSGPRWAGADAMPIFPGAAVTIPIIPAPGTAVLLGSALLLTARRSRKH